MKFHFGSSRFLHGLRHALRLFKTFILRKETFYLTLFVLLSWVFIYLINKLNPYSKLNYLVDSDDDFLEKFDTYLNSSQTTLIDMKKWIKNNYESIGLLSPSEPLFNRNQNSNEQLCVGIFTKKRFGNRYYLTQTIVSMLTRIKIKYQDRICINLFDVDLYSADNKDFQQIEGLLVKQTLNLNIKLIENYRHISKVKEAADYAAAMSYFYKNKPECNLVLLIEDDSVASYDWYEKIIEAVKQIQHMELLNSYLYGKRAIENWMCLKLFTSFRYFDWFLHPFTVLYFIIFSIILSVINVFLFNMFFKLVTARTFSVLKRLDSVFSLNISKSAIVILIINSFLIKFWLNSNSISPLGYGVKNYSQGFNTVANVYPRSKLNIIYKFIEMQIKDFINGDVDLFVPKDIALEKLRRQNGYDQYIVEPSIFQHVGIQSSLSHIENTLKDVYKLQYRPFQSYSFFKEYFKPIKFDPIFWSN